MGRENYEWTGIFVPSIGSENLLIKYFNTILHLHRTLHLTISKLSISIQQLRFICLMKLIFIFYFYTCKEGIAQFDLTMLYYVSVMPKEHPCRTSQS